MTLGQGRVEACWKTESKEIQPKWEERKVLMVVNRKPLAWEKTTKNLRRHDKAPGIRKVLQNSPQRNKRHWDEDEEVNKVGHKTHHRLKHNNFLGWQSTCLRVTKDLRCVSCKKGFHNLRRPTFWRGQNIPWWGHKMDSTRINILIDGCNENEELWLFIHLLKIT